MRKKTALLAAKVSPLCRCLPPLAADTRFRLGNPKPAEPEAAKNRAGTLVAGRTLKADRCRGRVRIRGKIDLILGPFARLGRNRL